MKTLKIFKNSAFKLTFKFELSYILIPAIIILYFYYPISRPIIFYHLSCIGIIGLYDSILNYKEKNNGKVITILIILIHALPCLSLIRIKQDGYINLYSLILLLIANLIIKKLFYWPYLIERYTMLYFYNFIYFTLILLRYVFI